MDTDSPKKFSLGKAAALSVAVGLLVGFSSLAFQAFGDVYLRKPGGVAPPGQLRATTVIDPGSFVPQEPVRLVIPAIGVDATIQDIGMSWSGVNVGVPTNFTDVGWYKYGPLPGMTGTAIIDGHLDGKYVPQAVFYDLGNLVPGDAVEVTDASGTTLTFKVTGSKIYDYTSSTADIFSSNTSTAGLDLITCAGDWIPNKDSYNERIVVFTELAKISG